jgi:hypothetical protein
MDDTKDALTLIEIYETNDGWRYRVGWSDDGNYTTRGEAWFAADNWLRTHTGERATSHSGRDGENTEAKR